VRDSLLLVFLTAIITLLMLTIVLLLAHGSWTEHRRRRRAPEIDRARAVLIEAFLGNPITDDDALHVRATNPRLIAHILLELSQWLRPSDSGGTDLIAVELGLNQPAREMVYSYRWPRRLAGARLLTLLDTGDDLMAALAADRHPLVRAQAAEWISAHPTPEMIAAVLPLLNDPDGLVRHAATDCLIRIGLPAGPALAELLTRVDGINARSALVVAAEVNHPFLLEPVLARALEDDADVRRLAALVLGTLGGERAASVLDDLTRDDEPGVRAAAARSLGRLKHWPAAVGLARMLRDPDWNVRRESGLALRRLGAPGTLLLRRTTDSDDRFAADMAQLVLEVSEVDDELGVTT